MNDEDQEHGHEQIYPDGSPDKLYHDRSSLGESFAVSPNKEGKEASRRAFVERQKSKKMQDEEANFTYKPKIYPHEHRSTGENCTTDLDDNCIDTFDKLYKDAMKRTVDRTASEKIQEEIKKSGKPIDGNITFSPKFKTRLGSRQDITDEDNSTASMSNILSSPRTTKAQAARQEMNKRKVENFDHDKDLDSIASGSSSRNSSRSSSTTTSRSSSTTSSRSSSRGRGDSNNNSNSRSSSAQRDSNSNSNSRRASFTPVITKKGKELPSAGKPGDRLYKQG